MKKATFPIITGVILVLALIGVTVLLVNEKTVNRELTEEFQLQKEDLETEYASFSKQYDELKTTVANDSLSQLLEQEQIKTQRLLEELRTVKSTNAAEIRRLKKELATLRKVMVGYINQIDSLNRLTNEQKVVIQKVTEQYKNASSQITALTQEKKDLTKQVTLASQLVVSNVKVQALNKRGKEAKKVKDAVQIAISFTVAKNITAPTGDKTLYIRINKPDNSVLTKSDGDTFQFENRQIPFSIKKYIEYDGEEKSVTVYWDVKEFLYAGAYGVEVFEGGSLIGTGSFSLK